MARRTRADMEETRATLLQTGRQFFSTYGYANSSMDELTAQAGLTRGALYHHFGDKQGLLSAVVAQIDAEMDRRLQQISDSADNEWEGFVQRCNAYLEMALEPEIQRLVLRDARAVLGGASPESQRHCIHSMQRLIANLMQQGRIAASDPQALAILLYGCLAEAAFWIAESEHADQQLEKSKDALAKLLQGLKVK